MSERVLVTGGAGFLGSHLCERLLAAGKDVLCVDNFYTGTKRHVAHLLDNHAFELMRHDITFPLYVEVDSIYNLACPASPVHYQFDPVQTTKTSVHGAINMLGLAKRVKARILQASTSEVYGDPAVHPQVETYWGNVNPIGPRSCYDEGKRCAETLFFDYHRQHRMPVKVVRIFNSILADEPVVVFNDDHLHLEPIGEYADRIELTPDRPRRVLVPAFNPETLRMELRPASALIKHPIVSDAFELVLRYGRSVKVTGDHSVFVEGDDGRPLAKPVRDIRTGDHVAIPARLPVIEHDRTCVDLAAALSADDAAGWTWAVTHPTLRGVVEQRREELHALLERCGRNAKRRRNGLQCTTRKWMLRSKLPLAAIKALQIAAPYGSRFGPYGSSNRTIPCHVNIGDDLLWLLGFYVAEGTEHSLKGVHFISFASDAHYLDHAAAILRNRFGVAVGSVSHTPGRAPSIYTHSRALHSLFHDVLGLSRRDQERRIPPWIMQLPLSRVKHFLEGYRCGDGTRGIGRRPPRSGKMLGKELAFNTVSRGLALDLNYLLLRFGIVASMGRYESTIRKKYGDRRFPFYRLTICEVDNWDILTWDEGVHQTLNARRIGDLVWSKVREVRPCILTPHVFDFSVPESENFVAGSGVCCHNTYGPRMHPDDGRVVSNFIVQALKGIDITIYGDGHQTRSFCYVDDLIDGITAMMATPPDFTGPVNLGNPDERSMLELAEEVIRLTGSRSRIVRRELPVDDPMRRCPNIDLARKELKWQPKVDLVEGLTKTIAYFDRLLSVP